MKLIMQRIVRGTLCLLFLLFIVPTFTFAQDDDSPKKTLVSFAEFRSVLDVSISSGDLKQAFGIYDKYGDSSYLRDNNVQWNFPREAIVYYLTNKVIQTHNASLLSRVVEWYTKSLGFDISTFYHAFVGWSDGESPSQSFYESFIEENDLEAVKLLAAKKVPIYVKGPRNGEKQLSQADFVSISKASPEIVDALISNGLDINEMHKIEAPRESVERDKIPFVISNIVLNSAREGNFSLTKVLVSKGARLDRVQISSEGNYVQLSSLLDLADADNGQDLRNVLLERRAKRAREYVQSLNVQVFGPSSTLLNDYTTEIVGYELNALINDDNVNLRSDPTLSGKVQRKLSRGTKVKIVGSSDRIETIGNDAFRWYFVVGTEKTIGWVFGKYISSDYPIYLNEAGLK